MKTAICCMIKNEHLFLDEWISYHLNLGIQDIYLFEDSGSLSHKEITDNYNTVYLRSMEGLFDEKYYNKSYSGSKEQERLFDWCLDNYKGKYDWILFIDIDEFLVIKNNKSIEEFLLDYKDYSGIYIYWLMYGANKHITRPQGKVMENYTNPFQDHSGYFKNDYCIKSFVNLNKCTVWGSPIHKIKDGIYIDMKEAVINHYFTKSWEDWKYRIFSRGDVFDGNRTLDDFFLTNPDLLPRKQELYSDLDNLKPKNTCFLNKKERILFGGNIQTIHNLIAPKDERIIHYCWFGGNELTDLAKKCIKSWEKFMPDYKIIRWDETNFDPNQIEFTKQAYKDKCWAYVSDYVRFWAIYNYGGIYLDTDVELLKSLRLLSPNFFGIEKYYNLVAPGLGFRANKGNSIIKNVVNWYENNEFVFKDRHYITCPLILQRELNYLGYDNKEDKTVRFKDFTIYSTEVLCPKNNHTQITEITENTYSIHHYVGSWA